MDGKRDIRTSLLIDEAFEVVVRRMTPGAEYSFEEVADAVWRVLIQAPANLDKANIHIADLVTPEMNVRIFDQGMVVEET